jgi:hypothetical protein
VKEEAADPLVPLAERSALEPSAELVTPPAEIPHPGGEGDEHLSPHTVAWRIVWELLHDVSVAVLFCFFLVTFVGQAFRVERGAHRREQAHLSLPSH